jgi:hypothetical protein
VVLSAIVPTVIAQARFEPRIASLEGLDAVPAEEYV